MRLPFSRDFATRESSISGLKIAGDPPPFSVVKRREDVPVKPGSFRTTTTYGLGNQLNQQLS